MKGLGSAEEEMPISHKIRQYRALLGFALSGEILWSVQSPAEEVVPSREYGGVFCTKFWLALYVRARDWSL